MVSGLIRYYRCTWPQPQTCHVASQHSILVHIIPYYLWRTLTISQSPLPISRSYWLPWNLRRPLFNLYIAWTAGTSWSSTAPMWRQGSFSTTTILPTQWFLKIYCCATWNIILIWIVSFSATFPNYLGVPGGFSQVVVVVIILHSAASGHGIYTTVFPSASASAQMKTQRPQKSDKTRSPEINSHTAKLHLPRPPRKLHSPPNAPGFSQVTRKPINPSS